MALILAFSQRPGHMQRSHSIIMKYRRLFIRTTYRQCMSFKDNSELSIKNDGNEYFYRRIRTNPFDNQHLSGFIFSPTKVLRFTWICIMRLLYSSNIDSADEFKWFNTKIIQYLNIYSWPQKTSPTRNYLLWLGLKTYFSGMRYRFIRQYLFLKNRQTKLSIAEIIQKYKIRLDCWLY